MPAKPYRIPHPRCRLKPSDGIFNAPNPGSANADAWRGICRIAPPPGAL
ncbi:TPA: hypothetical protein ACJVD8_001438 [Neisseria meningitidis]